MFCIQQPGGYGYTSACIQHMHHAIIVFRCYFHRGMHPACGSAANQQGLLHAAAFHFLSHMHHFVERWRNQAAQANYIYLLFLCRIEYFIG